ncbi:MAG: hypothetical protein PHY28_06365 [Dehalococcoidales bacterium]|nr:hypothetical protein [Dehalococcoidales bacterium]
MYKIDNSEKEATPYDVPVTIESLCAQKGIDENLRRQATKDLSINEKGWDSRE